MIFLPYCVSLFTLFRPKRSRTICGLGWQICMSRTFFGKFVPVWRCFFGISPIISVVREPRSSIMPNMSMIPPRVGITLVCTISERSARASVDPQAAFILSAACATDIQSSATWLVMHVNRTNACAIVMHSLLTSLARADVSFLVGVSIPFFEAWRCIFSRRSWRVRLIVSGMVVATKDPWNRVVLSKQHLRRNDV